MKGKANEAEVPDNEDEDVGEGESSTSTSISYHTEDFISEAIISEEGTVPKNILEFIYSFGYDCRKRFNLCVADANTLIFASGNLIHFYNVLTYKLTFRRCSTGAGIGHITKNPAFNHICIGENGINPPIIIYEWPSMEIVTVLNGGTTRSFSHLRYSPNGQQLVSQGGDPDYLITIWDWQKSKIALQCKSHGQDVYNVVFSPTMPGQMTSCGSGHIKCWKMAKTFTGLKLQGELGRFGKTEISDIIGVYPMPDEKIISGCEWGNILVWDEGLIKIEVRRKNHKPCHAGYVSQFEYINGELISIGSDGCINVWYYETIDQAEPSEDNHFIEVEPIYELMIGARGTAGNSSFRRAMLMQIQRQEPTDPDNSLWYAQDGNGGLWLVDLLTMLSPKPAKRLLTCHAGPVMDMDLADWATLAATIGQDGCLHVRDYQKRLLLLTYNFSDNGCCLLWLPCSVEASGSTLLCGFSTGVIRMLSISLPDKPASKASARLTQVLKPHTDKINCMSISPDKNVIVSGSEDSTVFVFAIDGRDSYPQLVPIGYVRVPSSVTFMTWKPKTNSTLFIGCSRGHCIQVDLPEKPQSYTTITYALSECKPIVFEFQSVKSTILREQARLDSERIKQEKMIQKMEELKLLKEKNPNIEIDEAAFLESGLDDDDALPELYIPEVPSSVLGAFYTTRDTVLLSMAGYDAGFTYEYSNPKLGKETEHISSNLVRDSDNAEIRHFLFYKDRKYIIFGMEHGEIRVCKVNPQDDADFSDYWLLPMHDNFNGYISSIRLSHDQKMLLTCGYDGNIFLFGFHDDSPSPQVKIPDSKPNPNIPETDVPDIEDLDYPSLEEVIVKAEEDRVMRNAKRDREETLAILINLTEQYNSVIQKNNSLPASQRFTDDELELDPRITADLNEWLKAEMDLVYRKMAYDLEKSTIKLNKLMKHFVDPITCLPFAVKKILKPDVLVYSLRELKLTSDFDTERLESKQMMQTVCQDEHRITEDDRISVWDSRLESTLYSDDSDKEGGLSVYAVESFLKGLSPETIEFNLGDEINQLLKKYRSLKNKLEVQEQEWKSLLSKKPDPKAVSPEDELTIQIAKETVGDYKLKVLLPDDIENRPTVYSKYMQIVQSRTKIHFRREEFNKKLRGMRTRKVELQQEVDKLIKKLKKIQSELPDELRKSLPEPLKIDYEEEFPEKNLELERYIPMAERMRAMKKRRQTASVALGLDDSDEEYEVLLMDEARFRPEDFGEGVEKVFPQEGTKAIPCVASAEMLARIRQADKIDTKLEREMKRNRAARKIYEQEDILSYIRKSYEAFDEELELLEKERIEIVYESIYMDLHLLTMHQELLILKKFEGMESSLCKKVASKLKIKASISRKIDRLTKRIEEKSNYMTRLQERIKENMARYLSSITEDKYYLFFKRICKKRYRAPKPDDASSSSSSSASSSSEEEEQEGSEEGSSEDSEKLAIMHMAEDHCPEDCRRELYEEAFAVRASRYEMEQRIRDEQRSSEILQKELDLQRKRAKAVESELQAERESLQAFLREKQRQLNDIDVTVILNLDQLQLYSGSDKAENIQNCIVFDKNKLSRLYARVGELETDTDNLQEKHKNDKAHLQKIKVDCECMKKELGELKEQIKTEMKQKFGQEVSLLSLYEAVLRRLIYDIKSNTSSLMKFYDDKINGIKSEYKQHLQVLQDLIKDNTEKLSFLTVLEDELFKLRKMQSMKMMTEEEINKIESEYKSDLKKLRKILKEQEKQKEELANKIHTLSHKCKKDETSK